MDEIKKRERKSRRKREKGEEEEEEKINTGAGRVVASGSMKDYD